jgi:hypothetical protein
MGHPDAPDPPAAGPLTRASGSPAGRKGIAAALREVPVWVRVRIEFDTI